MHADQDNHDEKDLVKMAPQELTERSPTAPSNRVLRPEPEMLDEDAEGIDLLQLWRVLVKRKWTLATFFLIVVTAVVTATFLQTPVYRASLVMQIEREVPKVVEFQDSTKEGWGPGAWDFYQTQYELLKSRSLAERVVERLNLRVDAPSESTQPESWMERLQIWITGTSNAESVALASVPMPPEDLLAGLTVEPIRDSRLVILHYDSTDPKLATRIVNAWSEAFITLNLERRLDASAYAKKFLEEQLRGIKVKLEDSERELVAFARSEGIINIDDRQTISNRNLQDVATALAGAEQERIQAEVLYRQIQGAGGQGLTRILESDLISKLKQTKADLEAEYQEGLRVYKPAYPKMVSLASRINDVQDSVDTEVRNIRSAIQSDYDVAKAREAMLAQKLEAIKAEVMEMQNRSIQYNILQREVDTNRQLYEGLLQQYKEVGIAGGVGTNNVSVVDKAEVPLFPFKPSLQRNLLVAIFLGLFGGIGLAFLFEHLDDTVKLPNDMERQLGIPVLGIIPKERKGARVRKGEDANACLALMSQEDPRSAFAEAYRSVRTALQFSTSEGVPRVLLVTSSAPNEGKSTTALSLGIQFAQSSKRVLLIDADLRNPSIHISLHTEETQGLTSYLAGDAKPSEITIPTFIPNLFVIPSGHLPPNPAELIASAKMVSLLSLAAQKFDQVIIDCPPVLGLADALILGNLASGTILVVESGSTRRDNVQGALKRLRTVRTHILGGILTKLDTHNNSYGYYQSHYYYNYSEDSPSKKRLAA